jgi:transcriptional regulator with XRE-family HTH domain
MSIAPIVSGFPLLSRMARAALDWTQLETSRRTGIPKITLARFETCSGGLSATQCATLIEAYESAGLTFSQELGSIGVSLRDSATVLAQLQDPDRRRSDYKGSQ